MRAQSSRTHGSTPRSAGHADRDQRLRKCRRTGTISALGAAKSSRKIRMENGGEHNTSARAIARKENTASRLMDQLATGDPPREARWGTWSVFVTLRNSNDNLDLRQTTI